MNIYESGTAYRINMNEASPEKAGETIPILHRRNNPNRYHRQPLTAPPGGKGGDSPDRASAREVFKESSKKFITGDITLGEPIFQVISKAFLLPFFTLQKVPFSPIPPVF